MTPAASYPNRKASATITVAVFALFCALFPVIASAGDSRWTTSGPEQGGSVSALVIDPSDPATLYAGTDGGVFKSSDGGQSWTASGLTAELVFTLAIDSSAPGTVYAGTFFDDVFKSSDGGQSWTAVNSGLTFQYVSDLVIDPSAPATLYAGTEFGGVFKSGNGGQSWMTINAGLTNTHVKALAIDPSAPAKLHAGTNGGVFDYEGPPARLQILPADSERRPREVTPRK